MEEELNIRITAHTSSALHSITLAEIARQYADPDAYLVALQQSFMPLLDGQATTESYTETVKHGVLEAVERTFQQTRALLRTQYWE